MCLLVLAGLLWYERWGYVLAMKDVQVYRARLHVMLVRGRVA